MTPRSFWKILIKILGLYIVLNSLAVIPQFLSTIALLSNPVEYQGAGSFIAFAYMLFAIVVYVLICWYCIFKTDWIIDKLKLDQGFDDERFEFNIHRSTILKIIIMVTGGLLLVDSFPTLCREVFEYFQSNSVNLLLRQNPETGYIIVSGIKSFIGYFMLTCSRMIVNFMEARRRKVPEDLAEE